MNDPYQFITQPNGHRKLVPDYQASREIGHRLAQIDVQAAAARRPFWAQLLEKVRKATK